MTTPAATSAALAAFTNSPVFTGKSDADQLLSFLYGSLLAFIAVGLVLAAWFFWPVIKAWLWTKPDPRTVKVLGFLRITLAAFPWQESQVHRLWRVGYEKESDDIKPHLLKYKPAYGNGWKDCGTALDRTIGVQITSRNVRLDLYIGIVWLTWREFKVAKPAPEKAK